MLGGLGLMAGANPGWITEPDILEQLVQQSGFSDVEVRADTHVFIRADLDDYWRGATGGGMRRNIDPLDTDQTTRVRAALAERLVRYQQVDGYHIPASALIATANR